MRAAARESNNRIAEHAEEWEAAGSVPADVVKAHAKAGYVRPDCPRRVRAQSVPGFHIDGPQLLYSLLTRNRWRKPEWSYLAASNPRSGISCEFLARRSPHLKVADADGMSLSCDIILADESARTGYLGVNWGLGGGNAIGSPLLAVFGTREQKDRMLVPTLRGDSRGFCLGITEPAGGSDVAAVKTTARAVEGGYIVNGAKKWITNAMTAEYMSTAVRTGKPGAGGLSLLIVPLDSKGVTRRKIYNTGVSASGSAYVVLEDVL